MSIILFLIFIAIGLWMIVWGLSRPDRIFQFPILAGSVWLLYVGPQALAVVINPHWVPIGAQQDGGVEMALFMACLCAGLSFLGYLKPILKCAYSSSIQYYYSSRRLFIGGCVLITISYLGLFKLAQLSGGLITYYSTEGNYQLEWVGLPVVYVFFVSLIYPGLALCLISALHKLTRTRILAIAIGILSPLANIVILGRRTQFVFLLLTFGLCFFFRRKWTPKRFWVIATIIIGGIMVMVMPAYRAHSQIGSDYSQILEIKIEDLIWSQLIADVPTEFIYPVVQLPATQSAFEFNYGIGFYNRLIKEWVPAILIGRQTKNNLFIEGPDFNKHILKSYSWSPPLGWLPLGITDAFREFWFFGAFLFFLVGNGFRFLWEQAYINSKISYQIFYIMLASEAMLTILHGITPLPFFIIYAVLSLTPIIFLSRARLRTPYRSGFTNCMPNSTKNGLPRG